MKSEERHQLETNDLATWIANFAEKVRPRLAYIFGAAVVLIVILYVVNHFATSAAQTREDAWTEFFAAQNPEQMRIVLDRYPNSPVAPIARVRIADALFEQGTNDLLTDQQEATRKLEESAAEYERVKRSSSAPLLVRRQAAIGQGLALESMGAIVKARAAYEEVTTTYAGSEEALRAQKRLEELKGPEADAFYKALSALETKKPSTELPEQMDLGLPNVVPAPPKTDKKATGTLPPIDFDPSKIDTPAPPVNAKDKSADVKTTPDTGSAKSAKAKDEPKASTPEPKEPAKPAEPKTAESKPAETKPAEKPAGANSKTSD